MLGIWIFAIGLVLDLSTTWYGVKYLRLKEGFPPLAKAIEKLGLEWALLAYIALNALVGWGLYQIGGGKPLALLGIVHGAVFIWNAIKIKRALND